LLFILQWFSFFLQDSIRNSGTFFGGRTALTRPKMASRIAKTPLVQLQRHLAAQAAPAAAVKKPADGIEVSDFIL
jgi:hypothetical protein